MQLNFNSALIDHSVEIMEIYSHRKKISSNYLFSNFFSKNTTFTKFFQNRVRVNFRNFHTVTHTHSIFARKKIGLIKNIFLPFQHLFD